MLVSVPSATRYSNLTSQAVHPQSEHSSQHEDDEETVAGEAVANANGVQTSDNTTVRGRSSGGVYNLRQRRRQTARALGAREA